MEKLKRVVIKEELVALTKDYKCAIILNQMIYWSERVKDFDKFIKEEKLRIATTIGKEVSEEDIKEDLTNGWIYKTSEELSDECMLGASASTIRRYLGQLVSNKWLSERTNPKYKWDKTKQYRINIVNIQKDLLKLGYFLEGYPLQMAQLPNFQNEKSSFQNEKSNVQNEKAIPEITTKTTKIYIDLNTKHVKLTQQQYDDLVKEYGETVIRKYINKVELYAPNRKTPYKDYKAAILTFINNDKDKGLFTTPQPKATTTPPANVNVDDIINNLRGEDI